MKLRKSRDVTLISAQQWDEMIDAIQHPLAGHSHDGEDSRMIALGLNLRTMLASSPSGFVIKGGEDARTYAFYGGAFVVQSQEQEAALEVAFSTDKGTARARLVSAQRLEPVPGTTVETQSKEPDTAVSETIRLPAGVYRVQLYADIGNTMTALHAVLRTRR